MEKKYWKSLEELNSKTPGDYIADYDYVNKNEMSDLVHGESAGISSSRRDFLKLCGFSLATTALIAGCERPVHKAIPYLFKPEEITPGMATFYASTFYDGDDYGSVLVKVRDGRPIKIEGNDLSPLSGGKAGARVQASLLELYDTARFRFPLAAGEKTTWEEADRDILAGLASASAGGGKIVVLTGTVISPSTRRIIIDFLTMHPRSQWIEYDPLSFSAMLDANMGCFSRRVIPSLHFDKADLIVSFAADFLGTWLMPSVFAGQYAAGRRVTEERPVMSRHVQIESSLSLTGANADERIQIKPSQLQEILGYLYERLRGGEPAGFSGPAARLDELATALKNSAGRSLVVCGQNDVRAQGLVNSINHLLNNYGSTIDLNIPVNLRRGNDPDMQTLVEEMNRGEVTAILMHNVNPLYDYPDAEGFRSGLERVGLKVSLAASNDETAAMSNYVCPDNHYLESWGDAEPVAGSYSLQQPVIRPLGNTRQMQESFLVWSGRTSDYNGFLKEYWRTSFFGASGGTEDFQSFWNSCLQKGVYEIPPSPGRVIPINPGYIESLISHPTHSASAETGFELEIVQSVAMGSGRHANNPWLQELPDPLSSLCWDNCLAVSPADAKKLAVVTGDVVVINGVTEIPVLVQPGQAPGTMSAAMGYGRTVAGKVATGVGTHVLPLAGLNEGRIDLHVSVISVEKTGRKHKMALTQTHHSMEGRSIVRETNLPAYRDNPMAGNEIREKIQKHMYTLYDDVVFDGLHWAMSIDLNACTGCGACVIACQAENNIPVIGKEEVHRRRIMHWIRIDRYYSGDSNDPDVHFMPVMCQHCDNAPCENVCPVAATNHSDEGINQMAYVRCIGTKYCINNCPYKVRRFNWFNYTQSDDFDFHMNNETGRLVLNPDVTVRERGIVEKCSFCIQRIQEAKIRAKAERRILREDELLPACAQTCPSGAIVFGNIADKNSHVYQLFSDKRNYHLLEELHTLPSVGYLTKVKNRKS